MFEGKENFESHTIAYNKGSFTWSESEFVCLSKALIFVAAQWEHSTGLSVNPFGSNVAFTFEPSVCF